MIPVSGDRTPNLLCRSLQHQVAAVELDSQFQTLMPYELQREIDSRYQVGILEFPILHSVILDSRGSSRCLIPGSSACREQLPLSGCWWFAIIHCLLGSLTLWSKLPGYRVSSWRAIKRAKMDPSPATRDVSIWQRALYGGLPRISKQLWRTSSLNAP